MTKVLFIAHYSGIGGAETNLLNIMRFASQGNFQPVGVLVPRRGPLSDAFEELGFPVGVVHYHALRWPNPLRYLQTLWTLRSWVKKTQADVIHLNHQWLIEFAVRAGQLTGCPVVCHVRNLLSEAEIQGLQPWLAEAEAIVGVSHAVVDRLLTSGVPRNKVHLIHDGIEMDKLAAVYPAGAFRQELRLSPSVRLVGVVGRVVPEKGIEDFVEAAATVLKRTSNVRFVVVGDDAESGSYIEFLKNRAAALGVESHINFTGFRRDVPAILQDLDLVVLPSRSDMPEGLPNSVLEALAAGRIVVATRNSGVPEVVHDGVNGLLLDCDDVPALAEAMERALTLPEQGRLWMQEAARQSVQDRTIENQVRQLGELYRYVLSKRQRRPD